MESRRDPADGVERVTTPLASIDPENFTPRLLALLSNALVWRESTELRARFQLGTNDWRVISALAIWPDSSSTEISEDLGMNKAVVSKSVNTLIDRGFVTPSEGPRGSRPLHLTPAGAVLHDKMMPISTGGEDIILEGLTVDEIANFNRMLREMLAKVRGHLNGAAETEA